jgi:hypothetical protein
MIVGRFMETTILIVTFKPSVPKVGERLGV